MIIKMDKTSLVVAFFVAAVFTGLFTRFVLKPQESFAQKEVGMPLNAGGMGPFDGAGQRKGVSGWAAKEAMPVLSDPQSKTVDPNQLMLMVGNKVDSKCCPSAFNTDTGCVCLTQEQKDLFAKRGGNRA